MPTTEFVLILFFKYTYAGGATNIPALPSLEACLSAASKVREDWKQQGFPVGYVFTSCVQKVPS